MLFIYLPFHKTLPRSNVSVNRMSVRFYETDCTLFLSLNQFGGNRAQHMHINRKKDYTGPAGLIEKIFYTSKIDSKLLYGVYKYVYLIYIFSLENYSFYEERSSTLLPSYLLKSLCKDQRETLKKRHFKNFKCLFVKQCCNIKHSTYIMSSIIKHTFTIILLAGSR